MKVQESCELLLEIKKNKTQQITVDRKKKSSELQLGREKKKKKSEPRKENPWALRNQRKETERKWKKVANYSWESVASVGNEKTSLANSSISNSHALDEPVWCTHLITLFFLSNSQICFSVFLLSKLWQFSFHNNRFSGNSHS